ncbi:MAG: hypothetical protein C4527_08020 [Candidatus Omnitrophota bacterium]|jgi:hypothetical protein|nr:MAG: hypothetical protein C4527_08020 [Candidatus Omnitrophota bacterium]
METSSLQRAIDTVEALSCEDQEILFELIKKRRVEQRRSEIALNAKKTLLALHEGRARIGAIDDLKKDLLDES